MEKNKPLELNLAFLRHTKDFINNEYRYINPELGVVISFAGLQSPLFKIGQPYRAKEGRIICTLRGEARISVNLMEYDLYPEMVVLIPSGSIIQALGFTEDFDFQMIVPGNIILPYLQKEEYSYTMQSAVIKLTGNERRMVGNYFSMLWETVQEPTFHREVVQHLLNALLYYIRYIQKLKQSNANFQPSHQEELFRRFITLVNEHSKKERTVGFYANKLCLTPRYLNTAIRQISRHTVMDWINQAVTAEAQVLLKHTDLLVFQIADELHFPNPSFFCKFFKRMTGMTPQEYQKR